MNEDPVVIRSETRALDALIQATIAQAEASTDQGSADRMLFLGNRHQSFPTAVVNDPVLEPVDKLVWMVIMLSVRETGGSTAFPGYEAIGKMVNVSSRSTIARAIAILRATRWLTLCARVRKTSGRFRGNVYALHDEPLPLADALHLDSDYMSFLAHSLGHGHARVRRVAQAVLDSIDEDIQIGQDVCAHDHPIEQRIQSTVAT
ncbi:MAG TPA: helix-turn-helix domain-containing protein, partial [Gammaproteobacteria bacterium]|nr:helix-turn-helix domain-containing protein [Gammaproteobacteria bacterium]